MKAAILVDFNKVIVDEVEVAGPLEVGQVLVKVLAATICGAQIGEISGFKGEDLHLPHLLGHEGCGEVIDIGAGVNSVKVGDRVVMHWRKGVGIDAKPAKWKLGNRIVGAGPITTFSEFSIVSENRLTAIDRKVSPDVASLMGCAVTTAFGIINNEAKLKIGESIGIVGAGGVGLNVIQAARHCLGNPIIAIDQSQVKLTLAKGVGADLLLNDIESLPYPLDVFVDCTGDPAVIDFCFRYLKPGGRLILVGQPHYLSKLVFSMFRQNYVGKTILDSQGGLTNPSRDIPRYIQLCLDGKLDFNKIITHTYKLDQINEAIEVMKSNECGRIQLEMA